MQIKIPSITQSLSAFLRTDFTVQLRQGKSPFMATILAVIILVTWKNLAHNNDNPAILLAACITIVQLGIGLMGYPNIIARDREKGVFQRLRVAPVHTWTIMLSRLIVQASVLALTTSIVLLFAYFINKFSLSIINYALTILASVVCGSVFLGIGQILAGFIKSADTLNSAGRFIYFPLAFGGALAEMNILGSTTKIIVHWSPYGTVQSVLQAALNSSGWNEQVYIAFALTMTYALIFAIIGIKWFKWNN